MSDLNQVVDHAIDTDWQLYWIAFTTVVGSVVTIASAIVPLTKTAKDDELLASIKNLLARFSIFQARK